MLKKTIFTLVALMSYVITANAQSSKIVYSNAMTHFYVTLYANNEDSITYTISETSIPMKNIWRLSDREETQVLYTFSKQQIIDFLTQVKENETEFVWSNIIKIQRKKVWGIKCISMENIKTHAAFNTNSKSVTKALETILKSD
jgi:hypothetical protein